MTKAVRGRPSKLTPEKWEIALNLREKGYSLIEIAELLGVDESTLYKKGTDWAQLKKKLNALKVKQEKERINKVSKALYDRAVGQTVKIKREVIARDGSIVELTEKRQIAGDVKAQQFYLTNKDPDNWRLIPEEPAATGENDGTIKIIID